MKVAIRVTLLRSLLAIDVDLVIVRPFLPLWWLLVYSPVPSQVVGFVRHRPLAFSVLSLGYFVGRIQPLSGECLPLDIVRCIHVSLKPPNLIRAGFAQV